MAVVKEAPDFYPVVVHVAEEFLGRNSQGGPEVNEEELKPCPFCGIFNVGGRKDLTILDEGVCLNCGVHGPENDNGEKWNSAYCWKEIDRLKAELADYGKRAIENDAVMRKRCYEAEAALQAKDAEIAELKERLDKITLRMGYAMLATSTHRKPEEAGKPIPAPGKE